ncbi:MAG: toll/interleukin-1 receptor domain-containing protein [Candidatus Thorarchaeota archaeon]
MTEATGPDVFIAHNRRDRDIAIRISELLEFEDLKPRIDEWEVVPGDSFVEWMNETLRESRYLVLIWSKNAAESRWVEREWSSSLPRFVNDRSIKIIPIRLDDEPLPDLLRDIVYIRYESNPLDMVRELLRAIYGPGSRRSHREVLATLQAELLLHEDPLPVIACPECGSLKIKKELHGDDYGTYEVITAKCTECTWGTYIDITKWRPRNEEEPPFDNY